MTQFSPSNPNTDATPTMFEILSTHMISENPWRWQKLDWSKSLASITMWHWPPNTNCHQMLKQALATRLKAHIVLVLLFPHLFSLLYPSKTLTTPWAPGSFQGRWTGWRRAWIWNEVSFWCPISSFHSGETALKQS